MVALASSEGGVFGPLISKGQIGHLHMLSWSVIPTTLNQLELELDNGRLQVPDEQFGQTSYLLGYMMLGRPAHFCKNN